MSFYKQFLESTISDCANIFVDFIVGGDRGVWNSRLPYLLLPLPPPSVGVPASFFYFYHKMLCKIARYFSSSPGSRLFKNPASRPFSYRLPYPSCPLFSWAPAPLSLSTLLAIQRPCPMVWFTGSCCPLCQTKGWWSDDWVSKIHR